MRFTKLCLMLTAHRGWWPVAGSYHPGDYGVPKNEEEAFEIIVGAVLTQNTAWTSVERALENLRASKR
ncbi:hypothetical protein [Acetomicrobium sp.]|uniref:hypothetical protein n=1 Tax=Acetomicrobium sp. TaxID=1872099 RepID=UPI002FC6CF3F